MARVLLDEGRLDEAAAACRAALERDFQDVASLHLLGLAMLRQGKNAEAAALLSDVADRDPDAGVLNDLSGALATLGLLNEAEQRLRQALDLQPDSVPVAYNLASLLLRRNAVPEAAALLRKVFDTDPEFADTRQILSSTLVTQGNIAFERDDAATAEQCYRDAVVARSDSVPARSNLGNALMLQNRVDEALDSYGKAMEIDPDQPLAGFAYSLALLLKGDFPNGSHWYESRRRVGPMEWNYQRRLDLPHWQEGMSLDGKRVLLMSEQGFGDVIQYARFAPLLTERAKRVELELPPTLLPLFQNLPGVAATIDLDEPALDCEIACAIMSLPLVLGTKLETIPAPIPYITIPEERLARWHAWLRPSSGTRAIGLACSGSTGHPHDRRRSMPLSALAPLLTVPNHSFVLVQNEIRDSDRPTRDVMQRLRFPGAALGDFADTGALLSHLDLLITIDSAVAHLAGALGVPVWLMLPYSPDHRWLLGRDDSPWYPSMRLFRQPSPGAWDDVIEAVRRDLTRL